MVVASSCLAFRALITQARKELSKNFSFNQCHTKTFAFFSSGKLLYKSNRKLFSCVCIA